MNFINRIIGELLSKNADLSQTVLVLPGKRPVVFIKKILSESGYSGLLPEFFTIEELIAEIAGKPEIKGIALWLFSFSVYKNLFNDEDFSSFLKWYPTLQKDWDDILKFTPDDTKVLQNMLYEERIKNWGEKLGDNPTGAMRRNFDFWRKMNVFLSKLKEKLTEKEWATSGMLHRAAQEKIDDFAKNTAKKWVFCGFNAFTPTEEKLVKTLLQWDKADCFFQADRYYMDNDIQEAGKFLREHRKWKEFNESREFLWTDDDFSKSKSIKVYEVPGNITQTKLLPDILKQISDENNADTAVILLDENLLPASLDALSSQNSLNITMGFPLKNLAFSNAVKKLFYIQKQQEKKQGSYYYSDLLAVLESLPADLHDRKIIENFTAQVLDQNLVYISAKRMKELLGNLWYLHLFFKPENVQNYLKDLIYFCNNLKTKSLDDIQFENISHFEKSFKIILNQISGYDFPLKMETLEVLINQLVNSETIDFQGEPLEGLQVMGLLETRLLNFKNIIMLSVNEGKLPLGNSQNTYLPFDVRRHFELHTFLENDSIYAYHFYRLLQSAEHVHLLYNALSSGVNTGEKSRFITQIEMESNHKIEHMVVENASSPTDFGLLTVEKTPSVILQLNEWKNRISASHLTSYLYNPIQFYVNYILKVEESSEVEEELSQKNYGNIVHKALQVIYEKYINKKLTISDLEQSIQNIDETVDIAISILKHDLDLYARGMNFIHKSIAKRAVHSILNYDLELLKNGNTLEIVDIERKFENIPFQIGEGQTVNFYGFIDRIDLLNGEPRLIDYKTAKAKKLTVSFKNNEETLLMNDQYKQALQLCIYQYYIRESKLFSGNSADAGIWSFAEVNKGVQPMFFADGNLDTAMISIKNLILEILDPEIPFVENVREVFEY